MQSDGAEGTCKTLPDGCVDIIVDLSEPGATHAYVAGLQSTASSFAYERSLRGIGVRLRPGAALALLDTSIDALTDDRAALVLLRLPMGDGSAGKSGVGPARLPPGRVVVGRRPNNRR